jgi:toxin HigB-1
MTIRSFADKATRDFFELGKCPAPWRVFSRIATRKLSMVDAARELADLGTLPGNRLEALKGSRRGQYSIRINDQYRICFRWTDKGATDVEIVDYH